MSKNISDRQWWQYHEQGYLHLGKLLEDADLKQLQQRIDDIMLGKVVYENMYMQLDAGGAYENLKWESTFKGPRLDYRKIQDLERDPLYLAYMQRPIFREVFNAWALLRGDAAMAAPVAGMVLLPRRAASTCGGSVAIFSRCCAGRPRCR